MAIVTQAKNIYIKQGSSFSETFIVKDSDGNAQDLTSYTANAVLAQGYSSNYTRTEFTTTITSASTGVITLSLSADTTTGLDAPARYIFDIRITYTDSTVTRVFEGIADVTPGVGL